ncbi:BamA/TamA family outer membrane protein [Sphingobacterium oryzagri]|uniref:BamA/TamA family outer membrane protein n=1 Tax=Sphingobacterium oryzagri TaxID=3025669 RepID=A0ABY7WH09_9SPHI|nr:BamA/TamA family outer membrane protein [Sphingobacterium sp. KACC 22765]WDF67812.1 BamA/TamA family outer membrane protein [Sphingobacterium sp. KACC 22765]
MRSHLIVLFFLIFSLPSAAQQIIIKDTITNRAKDTVPTFENLYDISDGFKDISRFIRRDTSKRVQKKRSGISILPNINYNPSIGFQIGAKVVGGLYLGDRSHTAMSTFATAVSYTTRGIMVGYLSHDTYTKHNKWNIKGGAVIAKMVALDYGMGMGNTIPTDIPQEEVLNNPQRNRYVNQYTVYSLNERLYKQLLPGMFVGAGVFIELKRNIRTLGEHQETPLAVYSDLTGYNPNSYNNNGLMFNWQYMTRDNPNSAYKGIYADVVLRMSQTWMGSAQESFQLQTDFRKYWQLSTERPNHVLAFWHWGSYNVAGKLAYLDLPGTGRDTYSRIGRGYTAGYFKGNSFFYSELEYRFPLLRNQFLSGVVFANVQTADDRLGTKLFQQWQPAAGTGLRLLFNKATRTNLCIDYAFGRFGQRGLFLGLNEAF